MSLLFAQGARVGVIEGSSPSAQGARVGLMSAPLLLSAQGARVTGIGPVPGAPGTLKVSVGAVRSVCEGFHVAGGESKKTETVRARNAE
jgi:hypothetical protein